MGENLLVGRGLVQVVIVQHPAKSLQMVKFSKSENKKTQIPFESATTSTKQCVWSYVLLLPKYLWSHLSQNAFYGTFRLILMILRLKYRFADSRFPKTSKLFTFFRRFMGWSDRGKHSRRKNVISSVLLCFGAGVLIATSFIHILPEVSTVKYETMVSISSLRSIKPMK